MKNVNCEKDVQQVVIDGLRGVVGYERLHYSLVESPDTSPGVPDMDICIMGRETHIELKYGEIKNGKVKLPELRGTQYRWLRNRHKAGGKAFVFVCFNFNGDLLWCLYPTPLALNLSDYTHKTENCIKGMAGITDLRWPVMPDWTEVVKLLTSSRGELRKVCGLELV